MTPTVQFIDAFRKAFSAGQLLKCTLAKPGEAAPEGLKNVYLRPVSLKKGLQIAFNFRYQTRDEVKNFDLEGAVLELEKLLGSAFLNADLLTPERDFSLQFDKKGEYNPQIQKCRILSNFSTHFQCKNVNSQGHLKPFKAPENRVEISIKTSARK